MADFVPTLRSLIESILDRAGSGQFSDARTHVRGQANVAETAIAAFAERGLQDGLVRHFAGEFEQAVAEGYADKDVAGLVDRFLANVGAP